MKRFPIITADGSASFYLKEQEETYHSRHGAIAESKHVFLENGLNTISFSTIRILEIGFGTGLNAYLTLLSNLKTDRMVHYTALEAFPLNSKEIKTLNYSTLLEGVENSPRFDALHKAPWEEETAIHENFYLLKRKCLLQNFKASKRYHLVYFDAFAPRVQPELWTAEIFRDLYEMMCPGAKLVTYCAKGSVRRILQETGFKVERLVGPPGKREMLRAAKDIV